jgi:hypothetical protein
MSIFLLPSTLTVDIEKMLNFLWWGHSGSNAFNLAMLGKQA